MDVHYLYLGQPFEWDTEKASSNLQKHGVSFVRASEIFFDPFICVVDATDREDQARDAAIGYAKDMSMLYVVHILRGDAGLESIRIISARAATPQERVGYENH